MLRKGNVLFTVNNYNVFCGASSFTLAMYFFLNPLKLSNVFFQDLCTTNLLEGTTPATAAIDTIDSVNNETPVEPNLRKPIPVPKKEDKAAWFKLFAELDPLANPDNIPGSNSNQSHAA